MVNCLRYHNTIAINNGSNIGNNSYPSEDIDKGVNRTAFPFAVTSEDDFYDEIVIPPPRPSSIETLGKYVASSPSDITPLIAKRSRISSGVVVRPWNSPNSIQQIFFGFLLEDENDQEMMIHQIDTKRDSTMNIKFALSLSLLLTTLASTIPSTLLSKITKDMQIKNGTEDLINTTLHASKAATFSVIGMAFGKFMNGPLPDMLGARRVSMICSVLLSLALLFLSICWDQASILWACFLVDFFQSVQWPVVIIILASHSQGSDFESGIYFASLASRLGSLLSIPLSVSLINHCNWRWISLMASISALLSLVITYSWIKDTPSQWHRPQNPIAQILEHEESMSGQFSDFSIIRKLCSCVKTYAFILKLSISQSLQHVLGCSLFWIAAVAHSGDAMIGTSQRILGIYYFESSRGHLSESFTRSLPVVLSMGTILGLAFAGNNFKSSPTSDRKKIIGRLYLLCICSCYSLAILSLSVIHRLIDEAELILAFQLISTFFMGFGIAVQSMIPGIIGGRFGRYKGLFSAYTDGVAFGLSSLVWRVVSNSVRGTESDGWAYGWATIALLIIICAAIILEFFDKVFNSGINHKKDYETITFL
jgi:MFS family permease